jgi:hypothetical protein
MKPSMWTHADGCFAVMQIIACVLPGIVANIIVTLIIDVIYVVGALLACTCPFDGFPDSFILPALYLAAMGTVLTRCANIHFAVIDPRASYWSTAFPSTCLIVLGEDFTFASGTVFISRYRHQANKTLQAGYSR